MWFQGSGGERYCVGTRKFSEFVVCALFVRNFWYAFAVFYECVLEPVFFPRVTVSRREVQEGGLWGGAEMNFEGCSSGNV